MDLFDPWPPDHVVEIKRGWVALPALAAAQRVLVLLPQRSALTLARSRPVYVRLLVRFVVCLCVFPFRLAVLGSVRTLLLKDFFPVFLIVLAVALAL